MRRRWRLAAVLAAPVLLFVLVVGVGSDAAEKTERAARPASVPVRPSNFEEILRKEEALDAKFPEHVRRKRQLSRTNFQDYLNNMGRADYDVRYEEGWQHILYPFGDWARDNELMGQAGRETQANLGFDCPYFGFRFNYTFVYPSGFVSFAQPPFIAPPFTFPNPSWPSQRDHSFIAPFYADSMFQWIGNIKISNTFFRSVHRPRLDDDEVYNPNRYGAGVGGDQSSAYQPGGANSPYNQPGQYGNQFGGGFGQQQQQPNLYQPQGQFYNQQPQGYYRKKRQMPGRTNQPGMVIDPLLLDNITRDVQDGYTGANGWRAEHAFIVTWYRMAYGGAPRALDVSQFDYVKDWQNTFQLVIATDEIRTFAIFNYARLNWTSSNEAGGLNGFGGKQAAMVGFNGGNGTGWYQLPYSGHGRVWKLGYFSNVLTPGRWVHRIDEVIIPAGCTNASSGALITAPPWGLMQGGMAINISGPCLRPPDLVKVSFESWVVDCKRLNRIRARCIMPMFHKTGMVVIRMSRDGGATYPFTGKFYILSPHRSPTRIKLIDDVRNPLNRWDQADAEELTLKWQAVNLTWSQSARVNVNLFGYWEDADKSHFVKIDSLVTGVSNTGAYSFKPNMLQRNSLIRDSWRRFQFGYVQVELADEEDGVLWSKVTPFPWYNRPFWQKEYGDSWPTDLCIEWFEYDGQRRNFIMDLTAQIPCPCKLAQALLDLGRFMPITDCDKDGDTSCPFNKGAQHCIQSVEPSWTGAAQQCCYDFEGYLMFTDDWEPDGDYTRFFQPGTPARAHAFGAYPYKNPPYIPYLSHFHNDIMPYKQCCHYAGHCEFFYWRRMTNGCQDYKPPAAGYIYGEPHVVTFDGIQYTFPGKGYYVLVMSEDPQHKLMVQVRMEQPDDTLWHSHVNATVITGVVAQENDSSVVQVFARKPGRRWRYKMDVYVDGMRRFTDKSHWKVQQFNGVTIRNPLLNMDQSEAIIMFRSGAAVRVRESNGMLDVMVFLPPSYNTTCKAGQSATSANSGENRCYTTMGLLGTWNNDPTDDLMTITGTVTSVQGDTHNYGTTERIYQSFGMQWLIDGRNPRIGNVLFNDKFKPIYNPPLFASPNYYPIYWPSAELDMNASRIFSMEQVQVDCMGVLTCEYDYILTGRKEVGLSTLEKQKEFLGLRKRGTKILISCGPLLKKEGVIKIPPAANYLDGDTVTFSCKPKYFLHGDATRKCVNGKWTPGWWVWCRDRNLEYALKWMTALLSIFAIVLAFTIFFCILWSVRRRREQEAIEAGKVPKNRRTPRTSSTTRSSSRTNGRSSVRTASSHAPRRRPVPVEPPKVFGLPTDQGSTRSTFSMEPPRTFKGERPFSPAPPMPSSTAGPYGPDLYLPTRPPFESAI